jgi:hypothetical protein
MRAIDTQRLMPHANGGFSRIARNDSLHMQFPAYPQLSDAGIPLS